MALFKLSCRGGLAAPYIMVLLGSWQRDRHQVETGWRRGRAVTKEECSVEPNRSQSGNTGITGDATWAVV